MANPPEITTVTVIVGYCVKGKLISLCWRKGQGSGVVLNRCVVCPLARPVVMVDYVVVGCAVRLAGLSGECLRDK